MKILIVEPHKRPRRADVPPTLESLQGVVGGYLEMVYPWGWGNDAVLVCDEDGRVRGKELNRRVAPGLVIAGTFFICGLKHGEFTDLPDDLAARLEAEYECPQGFVRTEHGIMEINAAGMLEPTEELEPGERDIYRRNGYADRNDYLCELADEYRVPHDVVYGLADMLDPGEDFDGLIASLEDAGMEDWD